MCRGGVVAMALPSVHQSEVPEQGLSLTCLVHPDELALSPGDGWFHEDLTLQVEIGHTDRGLSTRGVLSGRVIRECVRCLVEYEEPIQVAFIAEYHVTGQPKGGRGRGYGRPRSPSTETVVVGVAESDEPDEEVYPYDGERLEMAEMLREHVILSSPMQPLCREDCLGLCPVCGQNRNQRRCSCAEPREASPFAALREIRSRTNPRSSGPDGSAEKRSNPSQQ